MDTSLTKKITRQSFRCPVFGDPRELPPNIIPSYEDVIRRCFEAQFVLTKGRKAAVGRNVRANRVLRLYVSLENPSDALNELVVYILGSYVPVWFGIKCSEYITEGPRHVFKAIQTSRYLSDDLKKVVHPVIERNAFFAHPENILIAMIFDERKHIRELGLRRIYKARHSRQPCSKGKTIGTLSLLL
ncbi:unnamed protein product [Euphydryas editha]|uniref:Uncharacterized protein n=1 Tax=Euphydryas editha TaxID=104508 RepID=A0AAU9UM34_EUPED|nr:unnamed protein product [Euphydryas editha]